MTTRVRKLTKVRKLERKTRATELDMEIMRAREANGLPVISPMLGLPREKWECEFRDYLVALGDPRVADPEWLAARIREEQRRARWFVKWFDAWFAPVRRCMAVITFKYAERHRRPRSSRASRRANPFDRRSIASIRPSGCRAHPATVAFAVRYRSVAAHRGCRRRARRRAGLRCAGSSASPGRRRARPLVSRGCHRGWCWGAICPSR